MITNNPYLNMTEQEADKALEEFMKYRHFADITMPKIATLLIMTRIAIIIAIIVVICIVVKRKDKK